ncbi:MAG: Na/Pi symporter [Bernardetiaceae bacterium]|nr:Na/Pi symporter [Bernardetiaceae bacterium]
MVVAAFLFALELLSEATRSFGNDLLASYLPLIAQPLAGLLLGVLITAVVQSSTMVTSMLVAVVAAGALPVAVAVPVVIGANIGTTITSTIVSFGYVGRRKEFRRAFAAGVLHDWFNLLVAVIILPLETSTHLLSSLAQQVGGWILGHDHGVGHLLNQTLGLSFQPVARSLVEWLGGYYWLTFLLGAALLFGAVQGLIWIFKSLVFLHLERKVEQYLFANRAQSFGWGLGLTLLLHSSSLTTAALVPVVARKQASLAQVFPFVLGANIGTTFTALLAALLTGTPIALSIAVAHLLFNVLGALIFALPYLRDVPVWLALQCSRLVQHNRAWALFYVVVVFFGLPLAGLFWLTK